MRNAAVTAAAVREFVAELDALRWKSIATGAGHGMSFRKQPDGWAWFAVRDGNGNGIRTAEIRDGRDPVLSGPHGIGFGSGVRFGFPPAIVPPAIPPRSGRIDRLDDPIRFGASDLIAFSPRGSASSGTLYLTDGARELYGVVLFGVTGRVRVARYDAATGRWAG
jgi:hypothetical protein